MVSQSLSPITTLVLALLALHGASAFSPINKPQPAAKKADTSLDAMSRREAIAAATASAAIVAGTPMDAMAAATQKAKPDKKTAQKYYFNGVFRDMKHPEGYRVVAGAYNKPSTVILRDSPDGKVMEVPMMAKKDEESGTVTVAMDLGAYNKDYTSVVAVVQKDGCLLFPDGNVWKKEKGVVGVYIDGFAPYPKYRRVVLPGDGENVAINMVSGKARFDVQGVVPAKKKVLEVEFPGNKQCTGKYNARAETITWPDGNVWTKIA